MIVSKGEQLERGQDMSSRRSRSSERARRSSNPDASLSPKPSTIYTDGDVHITTSDNYLIRVNHIYLVSTRYAQFNRVLTSVTSYASHS